MISLTHTVYYVQNLQLNKPLFHFRYKFKPNRIQARGLRSEYHSSYLYASKYIILQNCRPSMDLLNLTQNELYLKSDPTTVSVIKMTYKVPLY
jgi:hypothetical protein